MSVINPYLTFTGNCEEAFNYYKSVFGGEFASIQRFGEMPPQEGYPVSESDKSKIMHVSLPISKETILMGSDAGEKMNPSIIQGSNFTLSVNTESKQEADRIFNDLSKGGKVSMPMENTFWGSYFGMCIDQFGISWMVSFGE